MLKKRFLLVASSTCAVFIFLSTIHTGAQEIPIPAKVDSDFWVIASPKEWPIMTSPGIRSGRKRSIYYMDFLVPIAGTKDALLFVNPKINRDNYAANEQNIGGGIRHLLFEDSLILGGNFYYDAKKTQFDNRFGQLGFGMEALSKWVDIRSNFYFPLSEKKELSQDISYKFASRSLLKVSQSRYEEPLSGLDYEAGLLVPYLSNYVETRLYLGGYHYFSKLGKNIDGIIGRIEIRPTPLLTIDVQVSNDNMSAPEGYFGAYVTVPFSMENLFKGKNPLEGWKDLLALGKGVRPVRKRMTDLVVRDIDVLAQSVSTSPVETVEVDGLTYVDNSNTTGIEDGSYEHPYTKIQDGIDNAVGDKYVYVRKGIEAYRLDEGHLVELNGIRDLTLWGSGYNGDFTGITATGYPVLQSSELSNTKPIVLWDTENITIMGLDVRGGEAAAIYASDSKNLTIKHCIVSEAEPFGGSFYKTGGIVIYTWGDSAGGSGWASGTTITDNTFYDNDQCGISISNFGGDEDLGDDPPTTEDVLIARNTFLPNTQGAEHLTRYPILVESWNGVIKNVTIEDNDIQNFGDGSGYTSAGIFFWQHETPYSLNDNIIIRNNNISSSVDGDSNGIWVEVRAGRLDNLIISGNDVSDVAARAIVLITPGAASEPGEGGGIIDGATVSGNTITGSLSSSQGGLLFVSLEDGSMSAKASNNIIKNGKGYGIWLDCDDSATLVADLGGGSLGSAGLNSIYNNELGGITNSSSQQMAQYNWWGQADDPGALIDGDIDYAHWLTSDPN
jgi:hypothetical protein